MKVLIVDDERLARQELKGLLSKYTQLNIIGECSNGTDAIAMINEYEPDLIFLDINMPGKTGFDILNEIEKKPFVIFITAYDEYAIQAFEVNALDYLLKPLEEKRLAEAIDKFEKYFADKNKPDAPESEDELDNQEIVLGDDQVFIKDGEKCWFVKLKNIKLLESEGNYVRVYFEGNKPLILRSLNNLDAKLDPKYFFRANRKYIINLEWVTKIENWFNGGLKAYLKDGEEIEISRRQAAKLKDKMSL